jgi:hypothetical protein
MINPFWRSAVKKIFIHGGIETVVIFTLCFCIYPVIARIYTKIDFLELNHIQNIIVSYFNTKERYTYIYSTPRMAIYKDKAFLTPISTESFMQRADHNGFERFHLRKDEIALAENTARKYRLSIGDTLYLSLGYTDIIQEYTLARIFNAAYGMVENTMLDSGVAVSGYDPEFESRLHVEYVTFTPKKLEDVPNLITNCNYFRSLESMTGTLYAWLFLELCIFLTVSIINFNLLSNCFKHKFKGNLAYLYRLGMPNMILLSTAIIAGCLLFLCPFVLGYGLYFIIKGRISFNLYAFLSLFGSRIIIGVFWISVILRRSWQSGRFLKWAK